MSWSLLHFNFTGHQINNELVPITLVTTVHSAHKNKTCSHAKKFKKKNLVFF